MQLFTKTFFLSIKSLMVSRLSRSIPFAISLLPLYLQARHISNISFDKITFQNASVFVAILSVKDIHDFPTGMFNSFRSFYSSLTHYYPCIFLIAKFRSYVFD